MVRRPLLQYLSSFGKTAVGSSAFRLVSISSDRRSILKTKKLIEDVSSPWTLKAAVCLQRLPVISADRTPIEQRFAQMMQEIELERSLLSNHELQLLADAENLRRRQADDYDFNEDKDTMQDIILAMDLEDMWEQKLKMFQPASRVRDDIDKDVTTVERCLDDLLVLLVEQQVGDEKLWLLPQAQWQKGETLRQTAERALATLLADFKATFLGNSPCGVYKYKLPKALQTESSIGVKIFFFKAILSAGGASAAADASIMWARRSELHHHLKPDYMRSVDRFAISL
ncbi:large ribosomal subunit protein mL46 isoform 2-T2 [Aulostomus maculatus]